MEWTEIIMKVPSAQLEQAADMAQMAVDGGIYVEDYSHLEEEAREIAHIDLIDEELLAKDREHGLVHLYISPEENPKEALAFLRERCAGEGIDCEFSVESCAEEDWINNWKQYFHPIPVGEKLLIRPTWEEAYDPQGRTVLHLEPGLAFGTGTHETTRLCLELLEKYLKPGMSLLDVGCGSGILSVAGLLLGAEKAVGVDIDALAVKTAGENAQTQRRGGKIPGDLRQSDGSGGWKIRVGGGQYCGGYYYPVDQGYHAILESGQYLSDERYYRYPCAGGARCPGASVYDP